MNSGSIFPFGIGPDVEQEVGVVAGGLDQVVQQLARRLVAAVGEVESPRVVHGLAGLQGQRADLRILVEPRGVPPGRSFSNIWKSSPGKGRLWWLLPTSAAGCRSWISL